MRCRLFARLLCCVILFTGLPLFAAWWQPDALFSLLAYLRPGVVWRVETTERVVALSLDDAPSSLTPDILNLLDKYDARATFFVLGRHLERHSADLTKWPSPKDRLSSLELQICPVNTSLPDPGPRALIARLRALGHEPAHHTWSDRMTLSIPRSELDLEFDRLDAILYSCPVEYPKWFRPGHGVYDSELVKFVESHGYKTVLGNVHPFDPQIQNAQLNAWHVLHRARPGAIIILHDGRQWTFETLRIVLPGLKQMGFEIVTIGELWKRGQAKEKQ